MDFRAILRRLGRLLPSVCSLCGRSLDPTVQGPFCCLCMVGIQPLPSPHCPRCALPFIHSSATSPHLCGRCILEPPAYSAAYAAALYEGQLRIAIQRFKFHQRPNLDRPLAKLLVRAMPADIDVDVVVPVPLHRRRLRERTYNQALLLARELGRLRNLPIAADTLIKCRATDPQQLLSASQRRRNLRRAFGLGGHVKGKAVLLVDDVMTTGVTLDLCSRVLLEGGAARVEVAVVGRAPL